MNKVDSLIAADPAVESRTAVVGFSFIGGQGPSYGSFIIKLKDCIHYLKGTLLGSSRG